jgi:hypothetical protein
MSMPNHGYRQIAHEHGFTHPAFFVANNDDHGLVLTSSLVFFLINNLKFVKQN